MCMKFDRNQKWCCLKQHLLEAHKITVFFTKSHLNDIAAYRFILQIR